MAAPTLVVIVYPTEDKASEVLNTLRNLESQYLIDLEDAVCVVKDAEGKVKLQQAVNLTATGAAGGAFWGLLLGLIFLVPVAGLVMGAGMGALMGKLSDYGIEDDFVKSLAEEMKPGSSGLFVLIRSVTTDKVLPEIGKYGGKVLKTSMSHDAEAKLSKALAAGGKKKSK